MSEDFQEFELNLFKVEDFHKNSNSRLRFWFEHIRENALNDDGDIFEFGVFRKIISISSLYANNSLPSNHPSVGVFF